MEEVKYNTEKFARFETLLTQPYINVSIIQRTGFGFGRSARILDGLIQCGAVKQIDNYKYQIIDRDLFLDFGKNEFTTEYDLNSELSE